MPCAPSIDDVRVHRDRVVVVPRFHVLILAGHGCKAVAPHDERRELVGSPATGLQAYAVANLTNVAIEGERACLRGSPETIDGSDASDFRAQQTRDFAQHVG